MAVIEEISEEHPMGDSGSAGSTSGTATDGAKDITIQGLVIDGDGIASKFEVEPQAEEGLGEPQAEELVDPDVEELVHPQAEELVDPQAEELVDPDVEELVDPDVEEEPELEDGFTVVRSRKFGMVRGLHPDGPYVAPADHVVENVFPWYPKAGPRRKTMKWAQARFGKYIDTSDGPAYFSYGTYGPNNNLEY